MKVKVKATREAWYNKQRIEVGKIVDFEGDELPVWGTLADGEGVRGKCNEPLGVPTNLESSANEVNVTFNATPAIVEGETVEKEQEGERTEVVESEGLPPITAPDETEEVETEKTDAENDAEMLIKLEALRDIAVENNIWCDIPAELTPEEEYKLLYDELTQKGITVNI